MKRSIMIVVLRGLTLVVISGCGYRPIALEERYRSGETIRVACLGDSLTLTGGTNAYPALLQHRLGGPWEVTSYAMGQTAVLKIGDNPILLSDNFQALLESEPHAVIILLGTNDLKPRHWYYKTGFIRDYTWMLKQLQTIPTRPVILISCPPPAFPGQWGIRDDVIREEINPVLKKIAERQNLPVVDLYPVFEGHPEMFPDQIHPDERGVKIMADTFARVLLDEVEPGDG